MEKGSLIGGMDGLYPEGKPEKHADTGADSVTSRFEGKGTVEEQRRQFIKALEGERQGSAEATAASRRLLG